LNPSWVVEMDEYLKCFMWCENTAQVEGIFLSHNDKIDNVFRDRVLEAKNHHEYKLSVAKMRMLCWMFGKTRRDKIKNVMLRDRRN